jgi:hypothetical protein
MRALSTVSHSFGAPGGREVDGLLGTGAVATAPRTRGAVRVGTGGVRAAAGSRAGLGGSKASAGGIEPSTDVVTGGIEPSTGLVTGGTASIRRSFAPMPAARPNTIAAPAPAVRHASSGRGPLVVAGLPAALAGLGGQRRTITGITPVLSAATHRRSATAVGRPAVGLIRRRRAADQPGTAAWSAPSTRRRTWASGGTDRPGSAAARGGLEVAPVTRPAAPPPGTPRSRGTAGPAGRRTTAFPDAVRGLPAYRLPGSIQSLLPGDRATFALASIGSARTISAARTAAAPGATSVRAAAPGASVARRATVVQGATAVQGATVARRAATAEGPTPRRPYTDASIPGQPATGAAADSITGTAAGPNAWARPGSTASPADARLGATGLRPRPAREASAQNGVGYGDPGAGHALPPLAVGSTRSAGLLLRQAIPPAGMIAAASSATIRRMPPSPPRGTPRLASHRQPAPGRGPDVPRSADPNWSFAAVGVTGDRALTDATIGARTRGSRSVTPAGPGANPTTWAPPNPSGDRTPASSRRASLLDLVPPSLFDRARAGLAAASGAGPGSNIDQFTVSPSGMAPASSEVARVTQPTDNAPAERQRIAEALTSREWDELVDVIVDRLEDRVLDELARRGRRFTPGVF